jgi:electron transfer flavoprotein beta subunit
VISIREGADAVAAAAAVLQSVDVILTGCRAERGAGSGIFPYALADALSRPVVANALEVQISQDSSGSAVRIRQFLPKGQRRQIGCQTPIVIAVHPFAPVSLKYAYARQMAGKIEASEGTHLASVGLAPEWVVDKGSRRPIRLQAQEKKAGHARLLSAIASEAKGGVVAFEGTTVDKAQVVLNYLREHRLVDF